MNIFREILDAKNLTTYEVGLLQTRAYRALKQQTGLALLPYNITSTEWAFLGMLSMESDGIRSSDLAELLGVEAPFVTSLYNKFAKKHIVSQKKDTLDKRAKLLALTTEGQALVKEIEAMLRKESKKWLSGVSIRDLLAYIRVLKILGK